MKKWLVNKIIKFISRLILKIDAEELKKMPAQGPLIVVTNHINFLDAPVILSHLYPRPTTGLVKKETWDHWFTGFLFNVWDGIPIDRSIADFTAFRKAKEALNENKILAVAPEGTRTETGELIRAKPGIGYLIAHCDSPILPVAHYGQENFSKNFKHLRRTSMNIRVGRPFRILVDKREKDKQVIQAVADAIMMEIAQLLPEKYRGVYSDGAFERENYIAYLD